MIVRTSQTNFDCFRRSCLITGFIRSFSLTRINDDRQVSHGLFDQLFRAMARRRIEKQRVTRLHHVATVSVPITDFTRQHIKKFYAGMTKISIGKRVFAERDQIRFDPNLASQGMPEDVVEMTCLGAASVDSHASTSFYEGAVATLLRFRKQTANRHVERLGKRAERCE